MSDPSICGLAGSAPPAIPEESFSSEPPAEPTLVCTSPVPNRSDGAGGAGGAGAQALVRQFGGAEGTSSTGEPPSMPEESPCTDEALRTIAACGRAIATKGAGGVGGIVACLGNLGGYIECVVSEREAKP